MIGLAEVLTKNSKNTELVEAKKKKKKKKSLFEVCQESNMGEKELKFT